ncbi:hypothetical protein BDW66DRAFT_113477 [Aspergillus desertorum]
MPVKGARSVRPSLTTDTCLFVGLVAFQLSAMYRTAAQLHDASALNLAPVKLCPGALIRNGVIANIRQGLIALYRVAEEAVDKIKARLIKLATPSLLGLRRRSS